MQTHAPTRRAAFVAFATAVVVAIATLVPVAVAVTAIAAARPGQAAGAVPIGAVPVGAAPVGAAPFGAAPSGAVPIGAVLAANREPGVAASARAVQQRLVALRYLPASAVTGVWDDRTAGAVIAFQGWEGLARDGVAGPRTRSALATARPPRPLRASAGRSIEVFRARGVTLLVEHGQLVRALHSSSGRPGFTTPAGSFRVFRRELRSWSVPYRVWLPYAAYFNGGIAFHGSWEVPAYPASHGCIRVPSADAAELFSFAQLGTSVTVY